MDNDSIFKSPSDVGRYMRKAEKEAKAVDMGDIGSINEFVNKYFVDVEESKDKEAGKGKSVYLPLHHAATCKDNHFSGTKWAFEAMEKVLRELGTKAEELIKTDSCEAKKLSFFPGDEEATEKCSRVEYAQEINAALKPFVHAVYCCFLDAIAPDVSVPRASAADDVSASSSTKRMRNEAYDFGADLDGDEIHSKKKKDAEASSPTAPKEVMDYLKAMKEALKDLEEKSLESVKVEVDGRGLCIIISYPPADLTLQFNSEILGVDTDDRKQMDDLKDKCKQISENIEMKNVPLEELANMKKKYDELVAAVKSQSVAAKDEKFVDELKEDLKDASNKHVKPVLMQLCKTYGLVWDEI